MPTPRPSSRLRVPRSSSRRPTTVPSLWTSPPWAPTCRYRSRPSAGHSTAPTPTRPSTPAKCVPTPSARISSSSLASHFRSKHSTHGSATTLPPSPPPSPSSRRKVPTSPSSSSPTAPSSSTTISTAVPSPLPNPTKSTSLPTKNPSTPQKKEGGSHPWPTPSSCFRLRPSLAAPPSSPRRPSLAAPFVPYGAMPSRPPLFPSAAMFGCPSRLRGGRFWPPPSRFRRRPSLAAPLAFYLPIMNRRYLVPIIFPSSRHSTIVAVQIAIVVSSDPSVVFLL